MNEILSGTTTPGQSNETGTEASSSYGLVPEHA